MSDFALIDGQVFVNQQVMCSRVQHLTPAEQAWLLPLLAYRFQTPAAEGIPSEIGYKLRRALAAAVVQEWGRTEELAAVAACFHASGIRLIVLKGAALAASHYPHPALRPRIDTDLFVHPDDRAAADAVLLDAGYVPEATVAGAMVMHQASYARVEAGRRHVVDLHWRLCNPVIFADRLPFDEVWRDARPLPGHAAHVRGPSPVHMLLHLLMHRVAHHEPAADLSGSYDLHLVAGRLSPEEWDAFAALAGDRGLSEVCGRGLGEACAQWATPLPDAAGRWVAAQCAAPLPPGFAPFFASGRRLVDVMRADLSAARGRARWRLLREHLLPPPAYMAARYGVTGRAWLPLLYVRRLLSGLPRMWRRGRYR